MGVSKGSGSSRHGSGVVNGHVDNTGMGQAAHTVVGVAVAQPDDVAGFADVAVDPADGGGAGVAIPGDIDEQAGSRAVCRRGR